MKRTIVYMTALVTLLWSCTSKQEKMEKKLSAFIASYEAKAIPLSIQTALTDWNANITGTDADLKLSEKASFEEEKFYTGKEAFTELKEIKESGAVKDPILARQLELIYSLYLGGQVDTALIAERLRMETEINKKYLNFRAVVNGKDLGDNQIEDILRNSTSSADLQTAWEAHKQIGPLVADDIIKLVEQRNLIAKTLGFNNFHEMTLKLSGQDPAEVTAIFEELDNLTRDAFAQLKGEIDAYYAGRYKINAADLRPWHYQNRYFQEAPEIYPVDFDKYYENQDPAKLAATFFDGIGLNVDAILAKSDLYEKPGKNQHAFSTDIDRAGD
ncbi:MAG: M2 family metallopeptidase, partial [Bacteroidales bacterium]|nr:M2 family metallopeptidase [Bacteroidales bacterium]